MLHIIQIVLWGQAEAPLVFLDQKEARSAYVKCARKHWDQRYTAYCDHHCLCGDDFETAQLFVNSINISEKSTVHYWTVMPENTSSSFARPDTEDFSLIAEKIGAIKEDLTRLLASISDLPDICTVKSTAVIKPAAGDEPATTEKKKDEAAPGSYVTKEWKEFAATIKSLLCGENNQSALLSRHDWRQDVYSNLTSLEYWDWVADRARKYRCEAEHDGYVVGAEPGTFGCFRFSDRNGTRSEDHYGSEWEAWCAAGLHVRTRNENG